MPVCTSTRSKQLWIDAKTANQVNWLFQIGGPDPTLKFWVIFFATTGLDLARPNKSNAGQLGPAEPSKHAGHGVSALAGDLVPRLI